MILVRGRSPRFLHAVMSFAFVCEIGNVAVAQVTPYSPTVPPPVPPPATAAPAVSAPATAASATPAAVSGAPASAGTDSGETRAAGVAPAATPPVYAQPSPQPIGAQTQANPVQANLPQPEQPVSPRSDHESVVNHVGVGWYGTRTIPLYNAGGIETPLVGIRYWFSPVAGLDIAAGAMTVTTEDKSKTSTSSVTTPQGSAASLMAHIGVPLSFHHSQHHSIQLIPQMELGYAHGEKDPPSPNPSNQLKQTNNGVLLQAGVAVGAEVHFGFMGLPHLSLDATLGIFSSYSYCKGEVGTASAERTQVLFSTSNVNNPWDFFRSNIGARYYF